MLNRPAGPRHAAAIQPVHLDTNITTTLGADFFPILLSAPGTVANGADISGANKAAEQMLETLGDSQAWAELRNTINGWVQNRVGEPTVVYAVITMDFQKPRFRKVSKLG